MNRRILTEIWIYPVKSLGGIRVKSARVMEKGLQYDRRWMLVDEKNLFMTQRNFPKMALFKLQFLDPPQAGFKIVRDQDSIVLPLAHPVITDCRSMLWSTARSLSRITIAGHRHASLIGVEFWISGRALADWRFRLLPI